MAFKIGFEKRAIKDIDNALTYYHDINPKLALKFNTQLQKKFKTLKNNPFFVITYAKYRSLPLKKFPFVILFEVNEKDKLISIFAVYNTNQSPDKKP